MVCLLCNLGILQPGDGDEEGDEILAELKQKQQELRAIGQHNLTMTKRLYRLVSQALHICVRTAAYKAWFTYIS